MPSPVSSIGILLCAVLSVSSFAQAAFTSQELASGSLETMWRSVFGNYDFNTDQQTGQGQSDIIGTETDPGFYTAYDTGASTGTPSDDYLAFRVRTNAQNGTKSYYGGYIWIGIDADGDNDLDAYINYTATASTTTVSIYSTGNGLNNSPSTTTVAAPNNSAYIWTNPSTFTNSNYRAVDTLIDGGTTNNAGALAGTDGNADSKVDWYVSFQIPFSTLISFLADPNEMTGTYSSTITGVDDMTPLRFVVASSTQANSFNQDIGGINGDDPNYDPNLRWDQQPGNPLSQPFTSVGVVPELRASLLVGIGGMVLLLRRRNS